jgi:DNA-binding response OmpR family regulator
MTKILFLEDDYLFAESIGEYLEECGFEVDIAHTGNKAIDMSYERLYDLYVIDLNVPNIHGFEVITMLHSLSKPKPIIVLTSRVEESDLLKAFDLGCTDYIKKPCSLEELYQRIVAALKRSYKTYTNTVEFENGITFHIVEKNLTRNSIAICGKVDTHLLSIFLQHPDTIISYDELLELLYPTQKDVSESTVRYHIHTLRKLLGEESIENCRGQGYKFCTNGVVK